MDFDLIKKNKPQLTDYTYLQKVIESKKPVVPEKTEPTLIAKIVEKTKSTFFDFIENNIFIIFIVFVIIFLLIYRYFQYKSIKNKLLAEQPYYGVNYESPYLNLYSRDEDHVSEHFNQPENNFKESKPKKIRKIKKTKKMKKVKTKEIDETQNNQKDVGTEIKFQNQYYQNNFTYPDNYNEQHNECVPHLLNMTNDRSLTISNPDNMSNLQIINSSSYAPHNLHNLNELHPWRENQNYNL